ncbi:MAG TPA: Ig-like domain-containing protein, partial [Mycobacteriales bacterium]|nr:Ig-like domain-containing protein [Mycobacteriales bacterium]
SVPSPSSAAKKVLAGNLLANATDEDQPPQTLSISASDTTSAQGGSVSVSANGAFSYVPAAGFTGTDTFNYTVSDGNGGTDTSTVNVTVATRVWYVKNNSTPGGTGRSTDPFDTLAEADTAANQTGDITYVYKGDGTTTGLTGGFSLLANQKLLGEPVNLVVGADTLATGTPANRPSLSGTVALASGSRVEAVDIAGSAGAAIAGTNTGGSDVTNVNLSGGAGGVALTGAAAGTFNFTNFAITTTGGTGFLVNSSGAPTINVGSGSTENVSATGGPAVDVRTANTASNLSFDAVSSTNSTGAGINLDSNGATPFSAASGSISGAAGNAVDINGGSGNVTYPGTLGNGAGNTADITGRTGGAISLSGDINDTNDAGGGITMSGNTGGSTTFSGSTKTLNT